MEGMPIMPKPTAQDVTVAWLIDAGCKEVKRLTGCIVLANPNDFRMFWYIGSVGSTRYGITRAQSHPAPKRFAALTGRALSDVQQNRRLPGLSMASLDI